jgi:hypothetical protein
MAAAPNGDTILAGSFRGTIALGGAPLTATGTGIDIWAARYRPDGSHAWSIRMGDVGYDFVYSVAVDSLGDVYLAGHHFGTLDGTGALHGRGGFVVKLFGANGAYIWGLTFGSSTDYALSNRALGITVIDPYTVVMCGLFTGTIDFGGGDRTAVPANGTDWILAAYQASTGAHLWSRPLTSTGHEQFDEFRVEPCDVLAVDGDVIATGLFTGTASLGGSNLTALGDTDVFVARFRGMDGVHLWSKRHGGTGSDSAYELATDGARVFVGDSSRGSRTSAGPI